MTTSLLSPREFFNSYLLDNNLLIQFLISEFLTAKPLLDALSLSILRFLQDKSPSSEAILGLQCQFEKLLGSESHLFAKKGALTKLKNYSEQFSFNASHQNRAGLSLYSCIKQLWLSAFNSLEILSHSLLPTAFTQKVFLRKNLTSFIQKLTQMSKLLTRLICLYRNNDKVIFFVLKNKERMAKTYGEDFLEKFFKLTPKKQHLVSGQFTKNFQETGLEHLIPLLK